MAKFTSRDVLKFDIVTKLMDVPGGTMPTNVRIPEGTQIGPLNSSDELYTQWVEKVHNVKFSTGWKTAATTRVIAITHVHYEKFDEVYVILSKPVVGSYRFDISYLPTKIIERLHKAVCKA